MLILDEVTEIFEFDGQVNVVDHDLLGNVQHDGRKIQNARHAAFDECVGDLLSGGVDRLGLLAVGRRLGDQKSPSPYRLLRRTLYPG